jgi:hypothetical protein
MDNEHMSSPVYGAALYGEPVPVTKKSRLAVAALALGVGSIPLGVLLVGAVPGVLAMVFGVLAGRATGLRGHALTGLICGAIGTVIAIVMTSWLLTSPRFAEFRDCYEQAQTSEQRHTCREDLAERLDR